MISKTLMTVEDFAELATSETEDFERSDRELIGMSYCCPKQLASVNSIWPTLML